MLTAQNVMRADDRQQKLISWLEKYGESAVASDGPTVSVRDLGAGGYAVSIYHPDDGTGDNSMSFAVDPMGRLTSAHYSSFIDGMKMAGGSFSDPAAMDNVLARYFPD